MTIALEEGELVKAEFSKMPRASSASPIFPFMFNDTQPVHRQIINFERVEASLLDHQATHGKLAYCQDTDRNCAERRCTHSKRQ